MDNIVLFSLESLYGSLTSSFGNRKSHIMIIGLDGAGKTTLLYKIKLDKTSTQQTLNVFTRQKRFCVSFLSRKSSLILVYANKQDQPNTLSADELRKRFELHEVTKNPTYVQPCIATTGEELYEGLDWLSKAVMGEISP
ncbi:unnamed protein product [Peronospora destructor]|uniref:ADP-ribosylation factor n=1 Tax=Peronospora destructor TaxID=86335 RepID=A0AAV0TE29_9STRA|nr:unnamed protein product [Peronospora destructor]